MKHPLRGSSLLLALTMLVTLLAMPAGAVETGFSDVPADAWYAPDVAAVKDLGIIQGTGQGRFLPQGLLTLAQAITLAANTRAWYDEETIPAREGTWYAAAVAYAAEKNICPIGYLGTDYNAACSRASMAYLFAHALPSNEYAPLNQVSALPDVENTTANREIFTLYQAGILTGSDVYGTFKPDDSIKRAEAVALINRVIHPQSRKTFTLQEKPTLTQILQEGFWYSYGGHDVMVCRSQFLANGQGIFIEYYYANGPQKPSEPAALFTYTVDEAAGTVTFSPDYTPQGGIGSTYTYSADYENGVLYNIPNVADGPDLLPWDVGTFQTVLWHEYTQPTPAMDEAYWVARRGPLHD